MTCLLGNSIPSGFAGTVCYATRCPREWVGAANSVETKEAGSGPDLKALIGYGNPTVSKAVLTTAIPAMPIVIMFALQYRIARAEAASAVFLSVMGSVVTLGIFIALTH